MDRRTQRSARTLAWGGALVVPLLAVVASASPASADTPASWPDPEPMSTMDVLLLYVGVPAGLFVLISLLVMAPSVAKGPRYRPGLAWVADSEQLGAQSTLKLEVQPDRDRPAAPAFTVDQRHSIDKAIAFADGASGYRFSVYVGACQGRARERAERLHETLEDPAGSVLLVVDPATREVEIVVGVRARQQVGESTAGLAVLSMQSAFGAGDLSGGIVAGVQLLGEHARRPESLHTD